MHNDTEVGRSGRTTLRCGAAMDVYEKSHINK